MASVADAPKVVCTKELLLIKTLHNDGTLSDVTQYKPETPREKVSLIVSSDTGENSAGNNY